MRYLIKNGSIIDPARRLATIGNVLVEDGKVARVIDLADLAMEHHPLPDDTEVINARGSVIAPGFIDLHTHVCETGEEHRETIVTATQAAARGGFTTICAMPDTQPAIDHAALARQVRQIARRRGSARIETIGALTIGRAGRSLTEMAELVEAGCVGFSDGGPIDDPTLMRNALAYAAMLEAPVFCYCEDTRMSGAWAMHEGATSVRLGLPGYPPAAEELRIARDIALADLTGAHIHICHISTAGGVALVRAAKERGLRISAEVTPHHLTLTDRWALGSLGAPAARDGEATRPEPRGRRRKKIEPGLGLPSWLDPQRLPPFDPRTRVNPPLRGEEDLEALIEGLRDGTIDAIATDHTPLSQSDKDHPYRLAAPGISGLETALGLVLSLVHRGEMDLVNMVAKLTEGPAGVLGRSPATLRPGSPADITIFDPDHSWTVEPDAFASRGRNTPVAGQSLKGQVMLTMSRGQIVFRRGNFGVGTGALQQLSKLEGILESE